MTSGSDEPRGVPWRSFYDEARDRLTTAGVASADAEARWIVEQASGFEGGDFLTGLDQAATQRGVAYFDSMMQRRLAGEPVQYVLGRWPFRELDLAVDRRALIPRPETEIVCGLGLDELDRQSGGDAPLIALDLGVGTGAIGLSLAFERRDVEVVGSDIDGQALALARANLAGIGRAGARVLLVEGPWFEPIPERLIGNCNLVISNPPYVARTDELPSEVADWEPALALFSDDGGFADAALLINATQTWLAPGGALVLELGETQLDRAAELATAAGYVDVTIHPDLAGKPRGLVARRAR